MENTNWLGEVKKLLGQNGYLCDGIRNFPGAGYVTVYYEDALEKEQRGQNDLYAKSYKQLYAALAVCFSKDGCLVGNNTSKQLFRPDGSPAYTNSTTHRNKKEAAEIIRKMNVRKSRENSLDEAVREI